MEPDEEVVDFLEHFGVKGMHWGIRNKPRGREARAQRLESVAQRRPTRGNTRAAQRARREADRRISLTGKQKFARNVAVAGVAGGAVGLLIAGALKKSGQLPVRNMPGDASDMGGVFMKAYDAKGKLISQVSPMLSPDNIRNLYG